LWPEKQKKTKTKNKTKNKKQKISYFTALWSYGCTLSRKGNDGQEPLKLLECLEKLKSSTGPNLAKPKALLRYMFSCVLAWTLGFR